MTGSTRPARTPAFDAGVLARLGCDVGDEAFASLFAQRYRQMLAGRVDRINLALRSEDVDDALDATLSLKVSSTTVGTHELARLAQVIEGSVRRLDVLEARTVATRLPDAATRADEALAAYLVLSA